MNKFQLSKMQEQFWILNKLNKENPAYNLPSVFRIKGHLNIDALKSAIVIIIKQHEILRTRFFEDSGHPWQVIEDADKIVFEIPVIKVIEPIFDSNVPDAVMKEIHLPFELESGVLFRVKLFNLLDSDFILTIVFHHIIADLQSRMTFSEELSHHYNYIIANSLPIPDRPSNQYTDFCQWQSEWLGQNEADKMIEEWEKEISKPVEPLRLPADFSPINIIEQEGRRKYFQLDRSISQKITRFAKQQGLSPFIVLLGAYSAFLYRLSEQSSLLIGVPFANRRRENFKSTFGCFTNILPIPVDFSDNPSFNILLSRVRKSMLRAHRKQEIPYLLLNSIFGGKEGLGMVQAGFTFEPPIEIDLYNLEVTPVTVERDGLQLQFFLTFWEAGGCFNSFFEYPYQFYKEDTINRFWEIFITLIKEALLKPDVCVGDINLIPVEDIKYILKWNNTESPFSRNLCIHKKFEQQVKQSPDAPALYFNNQSMSYSELNNHSNRLAHYLINKGIKVEDKIGICIDRSPEMMIGILGILKAGAAYLPLNHDNPAERLKVILENADPVLILSGKDTSANLPDGSKVTLIDNIIQKPLSEDASNPRVKVNSRNLAYIIYTSGSTGDPKGVMIEHHSVLNRLNWMQKAYFIDASDKLIQKTSITFDVSVWELFWWFFNGASLVLLEKDGEKDPDALICAITR
ncbi:MAG: condensation domain-containing protein, partial [Bacteroidales bacterium]